VISIVVCRTRPAVERLDSSTREIETIWEWKVVQKRLWPLCDVLKIRRAGFHAFRHMHATLLLETGATPKVAQRQLRHADSRVTLDHYAHLIDSSHREAVERAAAFLDRSGPKIEGWWSRWDSNPRPPRCHRGALPTAPRPHRKLFLVYHIPSAARLGLFGKFYFCQFSERQFSSLIPPRNFMLQLR